MAVPRAGAAGALNKGAARALPTTTEQKAPGQEPVAGVVGQSGQRWAFLRAACLWALCLFLAVNLVLWRLSREDKASSKDLWSGSGSIDLAVSGFKELRKRPTVVLLGSSLMMFPFWAMDREIDGAIGDIFHHHQSLSLEGKLKEIGYQSPTVYSLAIFGQMVSDAYIYVDEYLKADRKPDWLVFGIAPRDFSDHDLPAPMSTFTFKRLVGLSNFGRYASLYLPGWQDKADFLVGHACFFYGRRWRLQHETERSLQKLYDRLGLTFSQPEAKSAQPQAGFMLSGNQEERWANSLNEYRRRYRNIGEKDLSIQMGFLRRLLELCQEREIKVVLINMPLTESNRRLLDGGFYDRFRKEVGQLADRPGVHFVDLGDSADFGQADFWDTTHLNHAGGHKLIQHLLPIFREPTVPRA